MTLWELSWRDDPRARSIADRHYNRQSIGSSGFAPPGRCLVLYGLDKQALWITSWPFAEYVKHAWPGAWICSAFRNEGAITSSELIRSAVAATAWRWPTPPAVNTGCGQVAMVTFVDASKIRAKQHAKAVGRCYKKAGFEEIGYTRGGLLALGLPTNRIPIPEPPIGAQQELL